MSDLEIRRAVLADVPLIVAMLADDPLGATREGDPADPAYAQAFAQLDADPQQLLAVAERGGEVVGTLQLTVIPGLSRRGMRRALIEAVRVRADQRGHGTGRQLVQWAIDRARAEGCGLVQLTTDRSRTDAHRFYESLGFEGTHLGMKLAL
ncbi:GNAT family N-acetyltransferase [Catellatospora paridis]|uniref:GNAT family N-acetyltransferase n=1 Tax=Catellatospora paridis TaxID=1617086 RepID=UPI0012D3866B|nr:GNAT family N-acetyltransferase [Catellatospora paridis]